MSRHEFQISEERVKEIANKFIDLGEEENLNAEELTMVMKIIVEIFEESLGITDAEIVKHEVQ